MSKRFTDSIKDSVRRDYNSKAMTVEQIVHRYGVARRTVYKWCSASHGRRNNINRKAVYLSKDETEAVLLLIMVGEQYAGKYKDIVKALEQRLLTIADEFTAR